MISSHARHSLRIIQRQETPVGCEFDLRGGHVTVSVSSSLLSMLRSLNVRAYKHVVIVLLDSHHAFPF